MSETTWFITGASSGLGYAPAEHVLKQGERVAMGARTLGPMSDLAKRYPIPASPSSSTLPTLTSE
jgi:NADP-dependent 3-hydroxy acid dehydrogenase YdfG